MLPDFGWSELLVIAIILIVIVGPKDLPKMLRTFGKTTSSLRKMAGDFRRQFDDALKEAELDDVRQLASDMKALDPRGQIKEALSPLGKFGQEIDSELKKAVGDIEKADKPAEAKAWTPPTTGKSADEPAAGALPEPEPVNLDTSVAAAKPKPARKPSTRGATTAKTTAAKSTAAKSTASKSAPAKTTSTKATTKSAATKTTSAKPKTGTTARKPAAARSKSAAASKPAETKTAETTTAAKAATPTGKEE